jgi:cytosine deaminase
VDVTLDGGTVSGVFPARLHGNRNANSTSDHSTLDLSGFLLLTAPAEPHAHLDKALSWDLIDPPMGDLELAIQSWRDYTEVMTVESIADRARRAALLLLRQGTTAVRTHVDMLVGDDPMRGVRALVRVRDELCELMDIELVALAGPFVPSEHVDEALDLGVDLVGGAPHLAEDPIADLRRLIGIAERRGVGSDIHTDESLTGAPTLGEYARLVRGWRVPASAGHCVRLGTLEPTELAAVIAEVLASDLGIISLPITNLYLQGWQHPVGTPRGLTALRALLDAGVRVAAGADNVRDPFNPVGRSDALETASLLVSAGHRSQLRCAFRDVAARRRRAGRCSRRAARRSRHQPLGCHRQRLRGPLRHSRGPSCRPEHRELRRCGAHPVPEIPRPLPSRNEVMPSMSAISPTKPSRSAASASTLLDFRNVAMQFPNGTVALRDIDLTVNRGEFVTVVGPSGCGKSTLLRIASGLETASEGTAEVDTKRIGYVFQDATLLPWRSVQDNVELLAELNGMKPKERRAKAQEAIDLVGLGGFEKNLPKQLSGGMKMRTSLARSLTLEPELFLFDEPFGALDEITRERLNDELLRLFVEKQFAGLFITHSVSEAVYLSTKVVVMSGRPGSIVGTFDVPFPMPRDPDIRFTAEFAELVGEVSHALREGHH